MKYFIYLIAIILVAGLNAGVFNNLQIRGQAPNFLLLLAVCFTLEKKDFDFFFVCFFCGLLLDFYSSGFFGGFTLAFLGIGLILHIFSGNFLVTELNWKTLSLVIALALAFLDFVLCLYGLAAFKFNWTYQVIGFKVFAGSFIPALLYNLLLLYPAYLATVFVIRIVDNMDVRKR